MRAMRSNGRAPIRLSSSAAAIKYWICLSQSALATLRSSVVYRERRPHGEEYAGGKRHANGSNCSHSLLPVAMKVRIAPLPGHTYPEAEKTGVRGCPPFGYISAKKRFNPSNKLS